MKALIDARRDIYRIESICKAFLIAPSTYHLRATRQVYPERRSACTRWDESLRERIRRVWVENFRVGGARKVWRPLRREGIAGIAGLAAQWNSSCDNSGQEARAY